MSKNNFKFYYTLIALKIYKPHFKQIKSNELRQHERLLIHLNTPKKPIIKNKNKNWRHKIIVNLTTNFGAPKVFV